MAEPPNVMVEVKLPLKLAGVKDMVPDAVTDGVAPTASAVGAEMVTVPLLAEALYPFTVQLPVIAEVQALMAEAMLFATVPVLVEAAVDEDNIWAPLTVMPVTLVLPDPPTLMVAVVLAVVGSVEVAHSR